MSSSSSQANARPHLALPDSNGMVDCEEEDASSQDSEMQDTSSQDSEMEDTLSRDSEMEK